MITPSYLYFLKHVIFYQLSHGVQGIRGLAYTTKLRLNNPVKVGQKPTKGQKFPKSFLLVSSLSRNPENHFQTHPRIKALPPNEKLKTTQTFPFALLPSQVLFSENSQLLPLTAKP